VEADPLSVAFNVVYMKETLPFIFKGQPEVVTEADLVRRLLEVKEAGVSVFGSSTSHEAHKRLSRRIDADATLRYFPTLVVDL